MPKAVPHGAALNNSQYCVVVTHWLQQNPRLTPGKIQHRLIDQYGSDASFSLPHIRAWMQNYYPIFVEQIHSDGDKDGVAASVINMNESALFGVVIDTLDYHMQMIRLLEVKLKDAEAEYGEFQKLLVDSNTSVEDKIGCSTMVNKLRDQIIKFSKELREYKKYVDEWQRTHDYGERLGDILMSVVELSMDTMAKAIPPEQRGEVIVEFKDGYQKIARDFRIPPEKVYS